MDLMGIDGLRNFAIFIIGSTDYINTKKYIIVDSISNDSVRMMTIRSTD